MGTKETLAEMQAKHGPVVHFTDPKNGALYVFKAPDQDVFEMAQARLQKGDPSGPVNRELCLRTLVHPTGDAGASALEEVFKRAPRVPGIVSDQLADLATGDIEVVTKKE